MLHMGYIIKIFYLMFSRLRNSLSPIQEITDVYEVFVPVSSLSPPCDTGILFQFFYSCLKLCFNFFFF